MSAALRNLIDAEVRRRLIEDCDPILTQTCRNGHERNAVTWDSRQRRCRICHREDMAKRRSTSGRIIQTGPWWALVLRKTGLTVLEHQRRTVASFLSLRDQLGPLVIPVLQGYTPAEYMRCLRLYEAAGIELEREPVVGLGSVCKRSGTREAKELVTYLALGFGLRLHGFGIKGATFKACRNLLASADSLAWSAAARREGRDSNSRAEAMGWRGRLLAP